MFGECNWNLFRRCTCLSWAGGMQIWLEMAKAPSARERELLETVLEAWFILGRLGGFNTLNMQACLAGGLREAISSSFSAFQQAKHAGSPRAWGSGVYICTHMPPYLAEALE